MRCIPHHTPHLYSKTIWSRFAYSHFAYSRFAYSRFAYSRFAYSGYSMNSRFAYSALFVSKHIFFFFNLIVIYFYSTIFHSENRYVNIVLVLNVKIKNKFNLDQQLMSLQCLYACTSHNNNHFLQKQKLNKEKHLFHFSGKL